MLALWVEEKELPALLLLAHARDDTLGDEAVVEIVLRLIDDERRFGLEQQQQEERGGLLAGGEVLERLPRRRFPGGSRIESDRGPFGAGRVPRRASAPRAQPWRGARLGLA